LPLVSQAQVIGVLAVRGQTGRLYDDRDVTLAQVFAHQASLALENARLYQEAQRSYRELARAQAGLVRSETLRATGELAAGAAHHLNNLLTIVLGNIQLVMAHGLPPDVARRMSVAEAAAIRAGHVVHRLALFARSYPESRFVALDLNAIAADALRLTRPEWTRDEARGARLHVSLEAGDVALVAGDPTALRDVVVNLILNAVEALVAGGTVTVRTWTAGDRVALAVSDTGPGMTPDVQRRAFEPFFTTKGPGATGLGLSVTLGIVQRHGGELTIDSTPEQGTTVTAWLPTRSAAEAPPTSA
jgi:signal transduction histidine kinase